MQNIANILNVLIFFNFFQNKGISLNGVNKIVMPQFKGRFQFVFTRRVIWNQRPTTFISLTDVFQDGEPVAGLHKIVKPPRMQDKTGRLNQGEWVEWDAPNIDAMPENLRHAEQ
jgi:hypothetical protein